MKIKDELQELKHDVKEIKKSQFDTSLHLAKYNTLLEEHIKRTAALERRVQPIEDHVKFLRRLGAFIVAISGIVAIFVRFLK